MSEPHDVVKLLLARMESHPEEFKVSSGPERWGTHIDMIQDYGSEADKAALSAKLRDIVMGEVHEQVMEELCNGPEKRRKEEEEREYEWHLSKSLALTKQQAMQQAMQQNLDTAFANAYSGGGGGGGASLPVSTSPYQNAAAQGIVGKPLHQVWLDEHAYTGSVTAARYPTPTDMENNGIKNALRKVFSK